MADRLPIGQKARRAIFEKHNHQCDGCGSTENLVIHHILPVKLGGTNEETNLAVLCTKCHQRIHNGISFNSLAERGEACCIGRPSVYTRQDAEDYLFCRISSLSLAKLRNTKRIISDSTVLENLCEELHIVEHRNRVDAKKDLSKANPDHMVGYVVYDDGRREIFKLRDTFRYRDYMNDIKKKSDEEAEKIARLKAGCLYAMERPFLEWLSTKRILKGA